MNEEQQVHDDSHTERRKGSSIERVLQIIEEVAKAERPISPSDLSDILKIPKPSIHRLLQQLQDIGFLQLEANGRVVCGHRTKKLVLHIWQNSAYKYERQLILQKLSETIGESVGIAILDGFSVVYIDRVLANWPLQIHLPEGINVPVWASASGKLLLSQLSPSQVRRMLEHCSIYPLTKNTIIDKQILLDEIKRIRKVEVSTDNEEFIPGMVACAVPIPCLDSQNRVFATVFTHAPAVRKSLDALLEYVPVMKEAAAEMSVIFRHLS
ncbi:IclR family transcriptional regulator [Pelistega europaea]|uniref:IclR family transcriptional regulator n=2 Tax=Pelistega europaea TaxID=106147 RepID=A0A7Y4P3U9_9BURK|nr:IclR family transcriptional regulator [Pelistega europaea]